MTQPLVRLLGASALLGALFLAGCASVIPSSVTKTNVVGEVWRIEKTTSENAPGYKMQERMMDIAMRDCQSRKLIALPIRFLSDDVTVDNKPQKHVTLEYRCEGDTGYIAPYKGLQLFFSTDDDSKKKK